jgi:hypothetical protein
MKKRVFFGIVAIIAAFSIVGCKEEEEENNPFVLTVTGIPADTLKDITAASLMAVTNQGIANTPIAVAMNSGGTFEFYHPVSAQNPMPDKENPFNISGSYAIALAYKVNFETMLPEKVYMYNVNSQVAPYPFDGDVTLKWTDFKEQPQQP